MEAFSASVDLAWEWSLLAGDVLAEVQRDRALRHARRDATLRAEFLRDLAGGRVSPERLAGAADAYGLDLELPYVTVCATVASSAAASRIEAELRCSGATETHRVVLATSEGELLALCPRTPTASRASTLATGPPVLLSDAAASFAEARHVLETATVFHRTGVVGLASLGGLCLVTANDELAQRLDQERFRALNDGVADIEHTMLTYLEQGQNVETTAKILHVHGNTVRYRLVRFRELTHLDVHDTRDLVLTWWLLNWRQAMDPHDEKTPRTGQAAHRGAPSITISSRS
jgi:sugar diacid utilization regulator